MPVALSESTVGLCVSIRSPLGSTRQEHMAIRLHGISSSRAFRSVWAAEELGIDFEHVPTTFGADSKEDGYLAVNPNGRVPALNDDGFNLF